MPNPTIAAGYPKALLDFAVSSGADRQMLVSDRVSVPMILRIRTTASRWRITWPC